VRHNAQCLHSHKSSSETRFFESPNRAPGDAGTRLAAPVGLELTKRLSTEGHEVQFVGKA